MENVIYGRTWSIINTHKTYRDLYENGTWKRQVYTKTKKSWRDFIVLSPEGCFTISIQNKCNPMHKVYCSGSIINNDVSFFMNDPAWKALIEDMDNNIPAFRYWCQKLDKIGNTAISILSVLMLNKDVRETESMLMMVFRRVPGFNGGRDIISPSWAIGDYLSKGSKSWHKKNHSERKALINAYREWIMEVSRGQTFNEYLYEGVRRTEDILLHRHDPDFIVEGWNNPLVNRGVYITNRDVAWLERTFEDEIGGNKEELNHYIICYWDWMSRKVDEVTDIRDPYFRRNRNFMVEHQQHVEERQQEIREAMEERRQESITKDEQSKEEFKERYTKYTDKVMERDGWKIYISNDLDQWRKRAEVLRQCIVSCRYYAKKEVVLIFVDKGDTCRYTAEYILKAKRIGQFYGDERPRAADRFPTQEVRNLVKEYIAKYL